MCFLLKKQWAGSVPVVYRECILHDAYTIESADGSRTTMEGARSGAQAAPVGDQAYNDEPRPPLPRAPSLEPVANADDTAR